jgi:NodT family efflux transporter outer membrane factor (OMF) lipoprotein
MGGCAAPPAGEAQRPPAQIPQAWSKDPVAPEGQSTDLAFWWHRFADTALNGLIEEALDANADIGAARAAVQQASALRDAASAALSPTLNASANAQHTAHGDGTNADALQAGINAAWDPDIFGAKKAALESGTANLMAVQARLGSAQGALATVVSLNYIALRSTQARLAIARQNLASQLDTLQLTRWRNQAGLIGAIEVEQAFVAAEQTRSQVPPLELGVERVLHALASQVDKPPSALLTSLGIAGPLPVAPPDLSLDSPLAALARRPDVRAAQYQVDKAQADVQQARAKRYPSLNLGGNLGVGAASLAGLADSGAAVAGVVLGLAGSLFDGGANLAQVRAQQAALDMADANYRTITLAALVDMEDAMAAVRTDSARTAQLRQIAISAERAALMARQRYASGLVDFQIVLETQRSQLATQDSLAQADAVVSSDQVLLYNALGGGWRMGDPSRTAAMPQSP